MVTHVPVQHDGIAYLRFDCVVVWRHALISQKCEQIRRGTLKCHHKLAAVMLFLLFCIPIRRGDLKYGHLQIQTLGAVCKLSALDPFVYGKQSAIAGQIDATFSYRVFFCLAQKCT